jgi:hypothetical protein
MWRRVREAMRDGSLAPMGGEGKTVEIDETVIGKQDGVPPEVPNSSKGWNYRNIVLTLVERGSIAELAR